MTEALAKAGAFVYMTPITQMLQRAQAGDSQAAEALFPIAYAELRRLAGSILGRRDSGQTLQATALVHEAYLKLLGTEVDSFESRSHFFAVAARAMRQILVDHARKHLAGKRGGGAERIELSDSVAYTEDRSESLLAVHEAIEALAAMDPRKGEVIEMRYFGGMSGQEIAAALGISVPTVTRDLRVAEAWLATKLRPG